MKSLKTVSRTVGAVLLLSTWTMSAAASAIFSDGFDNEAETGASGSSILNWDGGANWNITGGTTVDLVRSGEFSITCQGGTDYCVDLNGSNDTNGEMVSINIGPIAAGNYTLDYWLSGNQRDGNTDFAIAAIDSNGSSLGSSFHTVAGSDPWTQFSVAFSLAAATDPITLQFSAASSGGSSPNVGVLLDTVSIPEPGVVSLIGLALLGLGMRRKRQS